MSSGAPSRRVRVRWWDDVTGNSYAAVQQHDMWSFYEKELESVRWFKIQPTAQLIAVAGKLLKAGKHVRELPADYSNSTEANISETSNLSHRAPVKVFICYSKQDQSDAEKLFRRLRRAGFDPWMDKHRLVLGDDWEQEIKKAVSGAEVFLACLRPGFDEVGFRQQEVSWALDALRSRPKGRTFIIPMVIEPCKLPEWCKPFHAGDHLVSRTGFEDVVKALQKSSGHQGRIGTS